MEKCQYRSFTIPDGADKAQYLQDLHDFFRIVPNSRYAEVWVNHDEYPSMCALVNGNRGWLMYLRYEGDAGFSSRDPAYLGGESKTIDYLLSNGQGDEYPASWAIPLEKIVAALEWFATNKHSPAWVTWFNDSGDGNSSPNQSFELLG